MYRKAIIIFSSIILMAFMISCKNKIKQQSDEIYSRHLQRHVQLTIISTPIPDDKSKVNLLLLNDGQDIDNMHVKDIVDSLNRKKLIDPLVVVGIIAGDRMKEYGVAELPDYQNNGDKAARYSAFIDNELLPFIKKKAGVRKFNSIAIAGWSLGGLSAFDVAWDHADKINKVGIFSGSFWWRDRDAAAPDYSDAADRIMLTKIKSSRKRPHLQYWFYAGGKEETGDRDKDSIIDVVDDTQDLVAIIKAKNVCPPEDISYTYNKDGLHDVTSWRQQMPAFLLWAFGK